MSDRYVLRGTELRYTLTQLLQLLGPSTVTELVAALDNWNFAVTGRPTKTVSDALRWEMQHERVWRRGWGRYSAAGMPRSTEHRIVTRVEALRVEAKSLRRARGPSRLARRVASEHMAEPERITPPWWLKPMNKVFITVMRLGLIKDGPMVLTVPGRKSGKRYVATLTQGRRSERVRMVEVPADEARPLLHAFPTLVPTGVGFMKNAGLVSEGRPDEFEALAGRCAVFRFDPAS